MSSDLSASPITLDSLSDRQFDLLVDYLDYVDGQGVVMQLNALNVVAVLAGERPGALQEFELPSPAHLACSPFYRLITELRLPHHLQVAHPRYFEPDAAVGDDDRPVRTRYLKDDSEVDVFVWFASDPEWIVEHSGVVRSYERTHEDIGSFLGFPEEAVEEFGDGHTASDSEKFVESLVEDGVVEEADLDYMELTTFVPAPTEAGVTAAIERGKACYRAYEAFDERVGRRLATRFADRGMNHVSFFSVEDAEEYYNDAPDPVLDTGGAGVLRSGDGPYSTEYVVVTWTGADEQYAGGRVYVVELKTRRRETLGRFVIGHEELASMVAEECRYGSEVELLRENAFLTAQRWWM